jgi:hypothetical protein
VVANAKIAKLMMSLRIRSSPRIRGVCPIRDVLSKMIRDVRSKVIRDVRSKVIRDVRSNVIRDVRSNVKYITKMWISCGRRAAALAGQELLLCKCGTHSDCQPI